MALTRDRLTEMSSAECELGGRWRGRLNASERAQREASRRRKGRRRVDRDGLARHEQSGSRLRGLRDRIASVVRHLGWVPDGAARALATRRTGTIGAVFPTLTR